MVNGQTSHQVCAWNSFTEPTGESVLLPREVLSQIGEVLTSRLLIEEDEWVREELSLALSS